MVNMFFFPSSKIFQIFMYAGDHRWLVVVTAAVVGWLYLVKQWAYPRPLPGIPYNLRASRKFIGDLAELNARQNAGQSIRPWFLEQSKRHKSALVQIFLGPFTRAAVLLSDYREVYDIMVNREEDFKRGKKIDVFSGVLPHAYPAMESFDPRFKSSRGLMRDLMTPTFLHTVSAPHIYRVATQLLDLWELKTKMVCGHAFDASTDITRLSFDCILSTAAGLSELGGEIHRQLEYLHALEKADYCIPESISASSEPVELPAAATSPELLALNIDEESLWKGFYMPSPKLYHSINKLRPSVRRARSTMRAYIHSQTQQAVSRLDQGRTPSSALEYILQREISAAKLLNRKPAFEDPRIRDGIYGFLIAGHDTSTGSLAWALRMLVAHQDEQKKVRQNLRRVYHVAHKEKRMPTVAELLKPAPYLDAFIAEVLRCNCPVVTIAIAARRDTTILGHGVPQNTPVFLNLTGPSLNMPSVDVDETKRSTTSQARRHQRGNWDDLSPESFCPARWLRKGENGELVFEAAHGPTLAFSAGDRGCWGRRLGNLELRIVLSLVIWNFHLGEIREGINTWKTRDSLVTAPAHCFLRLSSVARDEEIGSKVQETTDC